MLARMLPESEKALSKATEVLDPTMFPAEMSPEFGEHEVKMLYTKFQIDFCDVKNAYREFKDSKGDIAQLCLKTLLNCVNTTPVSTAECERGFSKMNIVCNAFRSRLIVKHLSSLMFLSLTGPELSNWQPLT